MDLLDAEQVRRDELPRHPPVLTVGGEDDVHRPIQELVGDHGCWPRREQVVMRPHDRPGGAWGRHDEVRDGAAAEEHEAVVRAVLLGEVA